MSVEAFERWFTRHAGRLKRIHPGNAAAEIAARLYDVDARLGAEISESPGQWELVITTRGEPSLLSTARELGARLPSVPGWKIVSPRPARGFDFLFNWAGQTLEVETLQFELFESLDEPGRVGVRLFLPATLNPPAMLDDLLRTLISKGIGDVLSAQVFKIEVAPLTALSPRARPLPLLVDLILRRHQRVAQA